MTITANYGPVEKFFIFSCLDDIRFHGLDAILDWLVGCHIYSLDLDIGEFCLLESFVDPKKVFLSFAFS